MPEINFAHAGRQKASSAGALVSSEDTANAFAVMQTQLMGLYGVMPSLLPNAGGHVGYGVPHDMALNMSERTVAEYRERTGSLPPGIQLKKIQKLVEGRKQASQKVRLVFTSLIPVDHVSGFGMGFRHEMKQKIRRLV